MKPLSVANYKLLGRRFYQYPGVWKPMFQPSFHSFTLCWAPSILTSGIGPEVDIVDAQHRSIIRRRNR